MSDSLGVATCGAESLRVSLVTQKKENNTFSHSGTTKYGVSFATLALRYSYFASPALRQLHAHVHA